MYKYVIIESTRKNREIHAFLCDLYTFLQSYDAMPRIKPAYLEVQMMKLNFLPIVTPPFSLVWARVQTRKKQMFASKGLKLTVRSDINKRKAGCRTRIKRARKKARGPITSTPTTNTRAREWNKNNIATLFIVNVPRHNKDVFWINLILPEQVCRMTFLRRKQLFSTNCMQISKRSEQKWIGFKKSSLTTISLKKWRLEDVPKMSRC